MNKHIFQTVLLLMLALFGSTSLLRADEVTIGDLENATNNSYLPMNSLYEYSYSQQIYTADEIGVGCTINSITMWLYGNANLYEMPFDIYMKEVDKEIFESTTDWVTLEAADLVYSGSVTVHNSSPAEAYTFTLDTPFDYSGTGNLLIAFNNTTGLWKDGLKGMVFTNDSETRAIYAYQDGTAYDPYNPTLTATATINQRNVVMLDITPSGSGERYVISTVSNPEGVGVLSGAGRYYEGTECTLNATCSEEYYFINWTLEGEEVATTPSYTFTVTADATYVANFGVSPTYDITVDVNPAEAGTVTGAGTYYENQTCTLYAMGSGDYLFTNWTKDGEVVSTNALYSFVVEEDAEYIANFAEYDMATVYQDGTMTNQWSPIWLNNASLYLQSQFVMPAEDLTALKDKSIKGLRFYVTSDEEYTYDSEFIVYMTEYPSETIYDFMNYEEATQVYQGLMSYSNNVLTISFDTPYDYYGGNLLIGINDINPGTCYYMDPSTAYFLEFLGVDKRDASISNSSSNPDFGDFYPMQTNFLPKTTFFFDKETAPMRNITAVVDPEDAGYVEGTGEYHEGQDCTLKAYANTGYAFVNWTLNGEEVATTPAYTFTVTGDATYVAHYEESWGGEVELTVYDGSYTNSYVPAYGFYADAYLKCEMVYPAEELAEIAGGAITSMTFYAVTPAAEVWTGSWQVFVKEVADATISAFSGPGTIIYEGPLDGTGSEMTISFNTPYIYNGGNLLVGVYEPVIGNYNSISWAGETVEGASVQGYSYSGLDAVAPTQRNFLPKTTFRAEVNMQPANLALTNNDMGYRPLNAWMKPFPTSLVNTGGPTTIQSMYFDNEAFQLEGIDTPFRLGTDEEFSFEIGLNALEEGEYNGTLYVYCGDDYHEMTFDLTATAYTPVAGDVWETAIEVNDFPYQATAPASIYKNYDIPEGNAAANDAVYEVTIDGMSVLNVSTTGANSAVAVYAEDFNGEGGPDLDNTYQYSVQMFGDEFYEDFDNGIPEGWTTYDADGDGFNWVLGSEIGGIYLVSGSSLAGTGHGSSNDMVCSGSYSNATGAAINPDNYLVTPGVNIANGSIFSFWACAQDASYAAEHFGVAVSTDGMNFTMLDEWIMTAKGGSSKGNTPKGDTRGSRSPGNWYYYSVDLSEFAGENRYIAIRHFDCYDQFILNVDDVELSTGRNAVQPRDVVDGTVLNPGTYYVVVSSTDEAFPVSMNLGAAPAPVAAQIVYPADEATEVAHNIIMKWQLGYYTQEMQVLIGTENPPTETVIDWTDELVGSAYIEGLNDNTAYYVQVNERNSTGTTMGEVTSFTTHLSVPVLDEWEFRPTYVGEAISFSWSAIDNEQLLYYNIYLNDQLYTETSETSFSVDTLGYNIMEGYWFEVSAVYSIGESQKSDYFICYMSGKGDILGNVYEQDGETPIANANVVLNGVNEFGYEETYEFSTDENGFYSGDVHAGNYCVYGMKDEYQIGYTCNNFVLYGEITTVNLIMNEQYTPVSYVNVVEGEGNVEVKWGFDERSFQFFRVYRSNAYDFATRELVADSVSDNRWVDEEWANMGMGVYRYGVSAVYEGNHGEATRDVYTYGFENDLEGWTNLIVNADGGEWLQSDSNLGGYDYAGHAHGGTGFALCYSYVDYGGAYNTDAFLVSPQKYTMDSNSSMNFWADNANDGYPENFSVWVSTAENPTSESDFTLVWSGGAKGTENNNGAVVRRVNNRYDNWREHNIDLSVFAGQEVWIAFRDVNYDMYEVWIDDVTITGGAASGLHESAITWSDIIDKDMYLGEGEVSVTVTLNSGDSPAGAVINVINIDVDEQANFPVEPVVVDETGVNTWDSFRKGTYQITVEKDGYLGAWGVYEIYDTFHLPIELYEITEMADNLYVSPTGWAMWDEANPGLVQPSVGPVVEPTVFTEGFENGLPDDWFVIDANNDGWTWSATSAVPSTWTYYAGLTLDWYHSGADAMVSGSYINGPGALTPDEYLVTPKVNLVEGSTLTFWAVATDPTYPADHFGVFVSDDAENWTMVEEWTLSAKKGGPKGGRESRDGKGAKLGTWNEYSVDLSEFAGEKYIAFRHFDCYDQYIMCIDDVQLDVLNKGTRHFENYNVILTDLEGNELYNGETTEQQLQLPVEDLIEGETYVCQVAKVYSSDTTAYTEVQWVYTPCENYDGVESVAVTTREGGNLVMWTASESDEPYSLYFELYDSYGDGWNGGNLLLQMSNGYTETLTIEGGSWNYYYFDVEAGVSVKLTYTAGGWPEENIIYLYKNWELELATNSGDLYTGWIYRIGPDVQTMVMRDGEILGLVYGGSYLDEGVTTAHDYSIRRVYSDYAMSCEQEAEFKATYTITAVAAEGGLVNGEEIYSEMFLEGDVCTLGVFTYSDYLFLNWVKDGVEVSTDPTYSFEVTGDANFVANFVDMSNNWIVNPNDYENSMTVTAVLTIEDVEQTSLFWEIGAFAGDECRGSQSLKYYPQVDRYLAFITVYGNGNEEITFRIFNHETMSEPQNMISNNKLNFVANEAVGTPFDPYVIKFMTVVAVNYEFTTGWNWWSTNIELTAVDGMAMLQEGLGENASQISSQTMFTNYYAGYGWYGSLTTLNNESMYRVNMDNPAEFSFVGPMADPAQHPITITKGWNHIGFISSTEMSINDALADIEPVQGDMVKSQKSYANYYEGFGWYGSLNVVMPGDGLMYKSTSDESFTFTYPSVTREETAENMTGDNNHWVPNVNRYPENMTVLAVVELDGMEVASDNYELAAFANGECRGSIRLAYAEPLNRYVAFLTVAGDDVANMSFGLYNKTTGEESFAATSAIYSTDAMLGNQNEPFVVKFNNNDDVAIYPNPATKGDRVRIMTSIDSKVRVDIIDALGKVVSTETVTGMSAGITAPETAGVYTVRIISDGNNVKFQKLVVE